MVNNQMYREHLEKVAKPLGIPFTSEQLLQAYKMTPTYRQGRRRLQFPTLFGVAQMLRGASWARPIGKCRPHTNSGGEQIVYEYAPNWRDKE